MPSTISFPRSSPVRIYVLWHPAFDRPDLNSRDPASLTPGEKDQIDRGLRLARQIYHWFRLETLEGIPVYFRSVNARDSHQPPPIEDLAGTNYIIPLVDANMVASPEWRGYVTGFARPPATPRVGRFKLFPVAVDSVAYNMPGDLRKLNFVRHDMSGRATPDPEVLIGSLTEVICRDLLGFLRNRETGEMDQAVIPGKVKIFLSHAKADEITEAIAIKKFIQENTQCEPFFDETDIASGHDYGNILESAIHGESAGLIVIQGDHYADRPWCRKEIRDFLFPRPVAGGKRGAVQAFFIPPVMVVQTMRGTKVARTIPELGYVPCVRWQDDAARLVVRTLMREILLGLFYRLIAIGISRDGKNLRTVTINRSPDPIMVERILASYKGRSKPDTIIHPGYGLSTMEHQGLTDALPGIHFRSFSQMDDGQEQPLPDLTGKLISVSIGNAPDSLCAGAGDEHNQELLRRILRPLFRKQASMLYGGSLPEPARPLEPWKYSLNFTMDLLDLLLTERNAGPNNSSRLYNLVAWPHSGKITNRVRAQWTDICTFITVDPEDAGMEALPASPTAANRPLSLREKIASRRKLAEDEAALALPGKVMEARCLTCMRAMAAGEVGPIPPDESDGVQPVPGTISTFAHIYLAGKTHGFTGIMPGVFEEILHAFEAGKPVFIIGVSCGAAGQLARWLASPSAERPAELTEDFHFKDGNFKALRDSLVALREQGKLPEGIPATPGEAFDRLWHHLQRASTPDGLVSLMNNKLDAAQNLRLFESTQVFEISTLIREGIAKLVSGNA